MSDSKKIAEEYALKEFPESWIENTETGFRQEVNIGRRKRAEKDFLAGLQLEEKKHLETIESYGSELKKADEKIAELNGYIKGCKEMLEGDSEVLAVRCKNAQDKINELTEQKKNLIANLNHMEKLKFGTPDRIYINTIQQFIDKGLNGFAFKLMAESFLQRTDPAKDTGLVVRICDVVFTIERDKEAIASKKGESNVTTT